MKFLDGAATAAAVAADDDRVCGCAGDCLTSMAWAVQAPPASVQVFFQYELYARRLALLTAFDNRSARTRRRGRGRTGEARRE